MHRDFVPVACSEENSEIASNAPDPRAQHIGVVGSNSSEEAPSEFPMETTPECMFAH